MKIFSFIENISTCRLVSLAEFVSILLLKMLVHANLLLVLGYHVFKILEILFVLVKERLIIIDVTIILDL
jgi:hypothetical protein